MSKSIKHKDKWGADERNQIIVAVYWTIFNLFACFVSHFFKISYHLQENYKLYCDIFLRHMIDYLCCKRNLTLARVGRRSIVD